MSTLQPTAVTAHQRSLGLDIAFDDVSTYRMAFELTRVFGFGHQH